MQALFGACTFFYDGAHNCALSPMRFSEVKNPLNLLVLEFDAVRYELDIDREVVELVGDRIGTPNISSLYWTSENVAG